MARGCRILVQGWRYAYFLALYVLSLRNIERPVGLFGFDIMGYNFGLGLSSSIFTNVHNNNNNNNNGFLPFIERFLCEECFTYTN